LEEAPNLNSDGQDDMN